MKQLKCETCGSPLELSPDGLHAKCEVCGNVYEYKTPMTEYFIEQLNEANDLRIHMDFDDAIKKYRFIAENAPDDAEVYWGLLLSEYGVGFEKDPISNLYVPTFHRNRRGNILEHEAYKKALEYATPGQKEKYEEVGQRLRHIQEGIEDYGKNAEKFDVFISFKATDINPYGMPVKTIDRDIAYNIYEELDSHGIRTFFSEVTLLDMAASDYEAVIFNALNTCKVFILVGTSEEHINAVWVKNEWSRYRERLQEDQKNGGITSSHFAVVGGSLTPDQLPPLFARTQNVMLDKYAGEGYKKDISASVTKILGVDPNGFKMYGENEDQKATPDLEYMLNEDFNSYAVTGCKDEHDVVIVPSVYEGLPVTRIQNGAFKNAKWLELIQLPNTMKEIGDEAFFNSGLTTIKLPEKLEVIGNKVFYDNKKLTSMVIPASVRVIGEWAFLRCVAIESIRVEEGSKLERIGMGAFASCIKMESVSLPGTVSKIAKSIFDSCTRLTEAVVPTKAIPFMPKNHLHVVNINGGDEIPAKAFMNCGGLKQVTVSKGVKTIGERAFAGCATLSRLELPDGLETIGIEAFNGCGCLPSVKIQNGLKAIGMGAFGDCISMTEINIPESVTAVGDDAFMNCGQLTVSVAADAKPASWSKKWNAWKLFKKINAVFGVK